MTHPHASGSFIALVAAWWGMMAVMMLPVTLPWLRALALLARPAAQGGAVRTLLAPLFAAGYLLVWLAFSCAAAGLQLLISGAAASSALEGGVLAAAGLYQMTPLKASCLKHCRSPFGVLLSRWPLRVGDALRLGVEHGLFCLGCCWALMLVGVGAGAVGWLWMGALSALVIVEKLSASGERVARGAGVVLLALAVAAWVRP